MMKKSKASSTYPRTPATATSRHAGTPGALLVVEPIHLPLIASSLYKNSLKMRFVVAVQLGSFGNFHSESISPQCPLKD